MVNLIANLFGAGITSETVVDVSVGVLPERFSRSEDLLWALPSQRLSEGRHRWGVELS